MTPLRCPFCGNFGVTVAESDGYKWCAAICNSCSSSGPEVRTLDYRGVGEYSAADESRAIAEWNRRAEPEQEGGRDG